MSYREQKMEGPEESGPVTWRDKLNVRWRFLSLRDIKIVAAVCIVFGTITILPMSWWEKVLAGEASEATYQFIATMCGIVVAVCVIVLVAVGAAVIWSEKAWTETPKRRRDAFKVMGCSAVGLWIFWHLLLAAMSQYTDI